MGRRRRTQDFVDEVFIARAGIMRFYSGMTFHYYLPGDTRLVKCLGFAA